MDAKRPLLSAAVLLGLLLMQARPARADIFIVSCLVL